jgi:hypothetical protein
VVKIVYSCSEVVLRTTNYKGHYDLSRFRPLYELIALCPALLC